MNVLIVGLRGLGVETAKNLILAGPKSVTLYDPTPVTWGDLSSNFYCREDHVGKTSRADASFQKLQELNPYVQLKVVSSLTLEDHASCHVVAYTEILSSFDEMLEINEFVRG
jgi:ubiquitin-activating enzyme E1